MKRTAAVAALVLFLTTPLVAAPRDDDSRSRGTNPIVRIVHFIVHMLGDEISVPHP